MQQPGGQPLQVDGGLFLARTLLRQPALESGTVAERKPPDRHADGQGNACSFIQSLFAPDVFDDTMMSFGFGVTLVPAEFAPL